MSNKIDIYAQTITVPNSKKPGSSAIYRNPLAPPNLRPTHEAGISTLYDNFQHGLKLYASRPCLGHRPFDPRLGVHLGYVWQSYAQVSDRVTGFGSGLVGLYKRFFPNSPPFKWNLGIYAINRPEWQMSDLACAFYSLCSVALYDTFGPESVEYILNHAEIPIIVASANKIPSLLSMASRLQYLKAIVSMDDLDDAFPCPSSSTPNNPLCTASVLQAWAKDKNIEIWEFRQVEALGKEVAVRHNPPKSDDLATICYTSGTTGNPKGAMLTHYNVLVSTLGSNMFNDSDITCEDVVISYLPLAHIYQRIADASLLRAGGAIGFTRGNPLLLLEDAMELKPTMFPAVPRLLNRVYDKVMQMTANSGGLRGYISKMAIASKTQRLEQFGSLNHALWDRLVFNKIKQLFGGRVRFMTTGSAPLSTEVLTFFRIVLGCPVQEGYGQTENAGFACMTLYNDLEAGHVGSINVCVEMKLVDVPEMGYLSTDLPFPRGEICFRGASVFQGYYKDEEKTKETLDEEGWLHSGDIGKIGSRGELHIIDRKKNIFKLSQGEYIAPEKIENVYVTLPQIAQVFVHGTSLESSVVAVVVPDAEVFLPWAQALVARPGAELSSLCKEPAIKQALLKEMDQVGRARKLQGFELVKSIYLEPEPFSIENGLITPTFKLKRQEAAKHYGLIIQALYGEIKAQAKL